MAINFKRGLLSDFLQDEQFLVAAGLLSGGAAGQSIGQAVFPALVQAGQIKKAFAPKKRKIIKSADGFQRYEDTKEKVFPDVKQAKKDTRTNLMKELESAGILPGTQEYKDALLAPTSAILREAAKKEETSKFVDDFKETLPSDSPLKALPDSAMVDYITKSEIAKINKRSALTTSMKNALALGLKPGDKDYEDYIRGATLKTDAAVNELRQQEGQVLNPSQRDKIVKDNKFVENMGVKLNDVINKIDEEPSLAGLKGAARRFGNQVATAGKDFGIDVSSFLPKGSKEFLFDDDIATINALESLIAPGYARVLFPAQKITNLQITEAKKNLKLTGLTGADEVKARLKQISKDFDQFIETNQSLLGSQSGIKKFKMVNGVLVEIVE